VGKGRRNVVQLARSSRLGSRIADANRMHDGQVIVSPVALPVRGFSLGQ
jgi:hypothetical protein